MSKKEKLIHDSPELKIYIDEDRDVIKTINEHKSIATEEMCISTGFSFIDQIRIIEKENMKFRIYGVHINLIMMYLLSNMGIKNYKIDKIDKEFNIFYLTFTDNADYSFFKLKFFKQLTDTWEWLDQ